jgi:hypothetical protein
VINASTISGSPAVASGKFILITQWAEMDINFADSDPEPAGEFF